MLISVKSVKGGVSKTSLSYTLASRLKLYYATNDRENSSVTKFYDKTITKFDDKFEKENIIVFDAGGFIDNQIKSLLKESDIIIVPYLLDINTINSNNKLLNTLKELNKLNNIIVVINRVKTNTSNKKKANELKLYLEKKWGFVDNVFMIREIDIFADIMNEQKSLREYINETPLRKHTYSKFFQQDWLPFENYIKARIFENVEEKE